MKKRIILILLLLLALAFIAGCATSSTVKDSKELLASYYDAYNNEKYDDNIDMLDSALLDDLDCTCLAVDALVRRFREYGQVADHKITSIKTSKTGDLTTINLSVAATYDSEDTLSEEYIFIANGEDLSIIAVKWDGEPFQ